MKRALIVALSGLVATAVTGCKKEAPVGAPPEVYVADVVQKDVPVYLELVGQTRGFQDVEIRARVEGYLDRVAFTEGTFVSKARSSTRSTLCPCRRPSPTRRPNLATAEARLQKTNTDVEPADAPRQAAGGQPAGARQRAVRPGRRPRAQVDANKAAVDKATLDLGYTRITSPIAGFVGTTQVKAGNLVGRGESTLLTTVSQVDPILFRAGVSEASTCGSRSGCWKTAASRPRGRRPRSSCSSPTAPCTSTRAPSTPSSGRSTRPPAPWRSSSRSPTPSGSCGPGSTAGSGRHGG